MIRTWKAEVDVREWVVLWNVLVTSSWIIQPQVLKALEASARNHQCRVSAWVGVHWLRLPEDRAGGCPSAPSSSTSGCKSGSQGPEPQNVVSRRSEGAQLRGRSLEGLQMGEGCSTCAVDPRWGKGSPQSPWEGAQVIKERVSRACWVQGTDSQVSSPWGPPHVTPSSHPASTVVPSRHLQGSHLSVEWTGDREQEWYLASGDAWRGHLGEKPDPHMCPVQWRHKASNPQAPG